MHKLVAFLALGLLLALSVPTASATPTIAYEQCSDDGSVCIRILLETKVADLFTVHTTTGALIYRVYTQPGTLSVQRDSDGLELVHTNEVAAPQVFVYPLFPTAPLFDSAAGLNEDLGDYSTHFVSQGARSTLLTQSYKGTAVDPPVAQLWLAHLEITGPGAQDSGVLIPYVVQL